MEQIEINLDSIFELTKSEPIVEIVESVAEKVVFKQVSVDMNEILGEWSYRLPKGFPTMKDGKFTVKSELKILQEVLAEYGIDEMPDFTKKAPAQIIEAEEPAQAVEMTKEQLITNLSDPLVVISPQTLAKINLLMRRNVEFESDIEGRVKKYLTSRDEDKAEAIVDILYEDGNKQDVVSAYLANRTISAGDLAGTPKTLTEVFAITGLTPKALGNLAVYKWNATPRIGDLEVLLALLLEGGSRPTGAGDLAVNQKPCEVGGLNKRLTGQKGVNHPSMVQKAFVEKYRAFAEDKGLLVDFVSISGGAKKASNSFDLLTGDENWAISQKTGWFQTVGVMNQQLIEITKDSDNPVTKQELVDLLVSCLEVGFTQKASKPWSWVSQYMNENGTLQFKGFFTEFSVFYFDYYLQIEKEAREWFFLTNASQSKSAKPRDQFSVLAFKANGEALRPHIFTNIGLTLPSYSSTAGPQGVAFALNLGQIATVFQSLEEDEDSDY